MDDDASIAGRLRRSLQDQPGFVEGPLFGGTAVFLDGNAAVGSVGDELRVRVGTAAIDDALRQPHVRRLEAGGRSAQGWVAVGREGWADEGRLDEWVAKGVRHARSLPPCPRYAVFPDLRNEVKDLLRPGMRVLDVGAGATPTVAPELRPEGIHYVGLDISLEELNRAALGSYDEVRACSVLDRQHDLVDGFDLVVSLQTLEHIKPLDTAIENLRSYLRPDGQLIAQMTGTFTYFSLLNRVIPAWFKTTAIQRLHGRPKEDVFPAYYHHCWHGALTRMFGSWSQADIRPYYTGGGYLTFSDTLFKTYLRFEDWAERNHHRNLASNYIVLATR